MMDLPLNKNQRLICSIESLASDGSGIARPANGPVLFVKGGVPGDIAEILVLKVIKSMAYGKILRLLAPSLYRIPPDCGVYPKCGGCTLRHISYDTELSWKKTWIEGAFARIGGISMPCETVYRARHVDRYRNKAMLPVGTGEDGRPICGFYRQRSHEIIPASDCLLQHAHVRPIADAVLSYMAETGVPAYDEHTGEGLVRRIFIRTSAATDQSLVTLVCAGSSIPAVSVLLQKVFAASPKLAGVVLNVNQTRGNAVLGQKNILLWGNDFIEDTLLGLTFRISPNAFFQVHAAQAEMLFREALDIADLRPNSRILDLYCGTGTITLLAAQRAGQAVGAEIIPEAVADAEENARRNGVTNARFLCADAGKAAATLHDDGFCPDVVFVDPPRKGLDEAARQAILTLSPNRVVYISCNPATLARDTKILAAGGYRPACLTGVDMFPRSAHVETVVLLSKLKSTTSIEVKIDLDEMDLTQSESKAAYDEIKQYVLDKFGFKVSQLYIAQVKRKHGIIERDNHNTGEGKVKAPQVPADKEKAIEDALRHFQMI